MWMRSLSMLLITMTPSHLPRERWTWFIASLTKMPVVLPFEVENISFFKPIWCDGCEDLYSMFNRGSFLNNAFHQLLLFLRVILISSDKASHGHNKIKEQYIISPTCGWVHPRSSMVYHHDGRSVWYRVRIGWCCGLFDRPQHLQVASGLLDN